MNSVISGRASFSHYPLSIKTLNKPYPSRHQPESLPVRPLNRCRRLRLRLSRRRLTVNCSISATRSLGGPGFFEKLISFLPGGNWWNLEEIGEEEERKQMKADGGREGEGTGLSISAALGRMWTLVARDRWIMFIAFASLAMASFNRAKVLFAQDKNYKKGFKFDHVWPILKDIEKFADVNAGIQVGRMQHGNFASSQSEYSPTSDSPTQASPGLASFDFNMNDNDFGGTSERPIGVRKAKFKKRNDEESSKFMEYMKEENKKMLAIMEKNNADRQLNYEIQMLRAQTAAKKVDVEELREENLILLKDLTQVTDPKLHEFLVQEQSRIMHKRTKQGEGSQNTGSGTFAQYFEHLRPSDDDFPEY